MVLLVLALGLVARDRPGVAGVAAASPSPPELPRCLTLAPGQSMRARFDQQPVPDAELLARLVHAEGRSTGFADDPLVYQAIAWGVLNRVRLAEVSAQARRWYGRGVTGVVFQPGQFNPAISPRSRFSRDFRCPDHPVRWGWAQAAVATAQRGQDNPFLQTDWERAQGLSLVTHFYYPASVQARGPQAPWEASPTLRLVGNVALGGASLPVTRIRFYRLTHPPGDVRPASSDH